MAHEIEVEKIYIQDDVLMLQKKGGGVVALHIEGNGANVVASSNVSHESSDGTKTTASAAITEAESNASTAKTTAETADANATTAKDTADGIVSDLENGTTEYVEKIQGSLIVDGSISAKKIDVDALFSRSITTTGFGLTGSKTYSYTDGTAADGNTKWTSCKNYLYANDSDHAAKSVKLLASGTCAADSATYEASVSVGECTSYVIGSGKYNRFGAAMLVSDNSHSAGGYHGVMVNYNATEVFGGLLIDGKTAMTSDDIEAVSTATITYSSYITSGITAIRYGHMVHLTFLCTAAKDTPGGSTIATLPVGFRPKSLIYGVYTVDSTYLSGAFYVQSTSAGGIRLTANSGLDKGNRIIGSITYYAD